MSSEKKQARTAWPGYPVTRLGRALHYADRGWFVFALVDSIGGRPANSNHLSAVSAAVLQSGRAG